MYVITILETILETCTFFSLNKLLLVTHFIKFNVDTVTGVVLVLTISSCVSHTAFKSYNLTYEVWG